MEDGWLILTFVGGLFLGMLLGGICVVSFYLDMVEDHLIKRC
jgi:hypothetical protein